MSMLKSEAVSIALDRSDKHAAVTFYLAAAVLNDEPAMRQLCEIKAALTRGELEVASRVGNNY